MLQRIQTETEKGLQPIADRRGMLAHAVVRPGCIGAEAGVVLEGLEGHIFLIALATGLPAGDPVDGEHAAVAVAVGSWAQQILILTTIEPNGGGVGGERIRSE